MPRQDNVPATIARWREFVTAHGFDDFISPEDGFATCNAAKWARANSTGLYCWIAENGDAYLGQAVKVRRRLLAHWRSHKDLIHAAFMEVDASRLSRVEARLIKDLSDKFPTRNVKHAFATAAFVPFDTFMARGDQDEFLRGNAPVEPSDWRSLEILETKQAAKFRRLESSPSYRIILYSLRTYIAACVPISPLTENRFWSVTARPFANGFRINVGQQEVLTISHGTLRILALERLDNSARGPLYQTASFVHEFAAAGFGEWLTPVRVRACRKLVLHLARHTTSLNNGSHCPQLVRACFSSDIAASAPCVLHRPFALSRPAHKSRKLRGA